MELQTELREVCDMEVSLSTILRSLQREGYTMKTVCLYRIGSPSFSSHQRQVTRCALERNEQDRQEYMALISAHYRPDQLVFADESHFNRLTLRRPYAWALRGERAHKHEFFLRGTKYSILPALSLDGILHLDVVENAITGNVFRQFIEDLLPQMNEWPLPNSVLVVDNASIHKVAGIRELVEGHGARLLYLPAYSPDFNPIELAFSSIKACLRLNRTRINADLESDDGSVYNAIWEAVYSVTVDDAKGWYTHCGYRARPRQA
jgi:hypothetical protein